MSDQFAFAVEKAVLETFADVCFLDAQTSPQKKIAGVSHILAIRIHSPMTGIMELSVPLELKKRIVENIYGKEWNELRSKEIDDTLLELVNIVAGRFLHYFTEEKQAYLLGLPELLFEETATSPKAPKNCYYFDIEGSWMSVGLILQGGAE